jgi:hypothetical protein
MVLLAAIFWGIWNIMNKITFDKVMVRSLLVTISSVCFFILLGRTLRRGRWSKNQEWRWPDVAAGDDSSFRLSDDRDSVAKDGDGADLQRRGLIVVWLASFHFWFSLEPGILWLFCGLLVECRSLGQFFCPVVCSSTPMSKQRFFLSCCVKTVELLYLLFSFLLLLTEHCISVMKSNEKGSEVPVEKKYCTLYYAWKKITGIVPFL